MAVASKKGRISEMIFTFEQRVLIIKTALRSTGDSQAESKTFFENMVPVSLTSSDACLLDQFKRKEATHGRFF